jgi:hypothetical protein
MLKTWNLNAWALSRPVREGVSTDFLKFHYGCLGGGPPAERAFCGRLLPPWISLPVRAWHSVFEAQFSKLLNLLTFGVILDSFEMFCFDVKVWISSNVKSRRITCAPVRILFLIKSCMGASLPFIGKNSKTTFCIETCNKGSWFSVPI